MIDKIINDDEKSRKEFDSYLEVWEKSANLKEFDQIDIQEGWNNVKGRIKLQAKNKRIPVRTYFLRIAAILIVGAGLAYFLSRVVDLSSGKDAVYTEFVSADEVKNVDLADGSSISLNKNSKIIWNDGFGKTNRDIILDGEAFFDVERNENLPFKVHSLNSTVEVLGTSFNVKVNNSEVTVGVVSGKVALYESSNIQNRVELLPESAGIYSGQSGKLKVEGFDKNTIIWHTHEFLFINEPLRKVCETIADYYGLTLKAGPDVKFIDRYRGSIPANSLDNVLFTINRGLTEDIHLIAAGDLLIVRKID